MLMSLFSESLLIHPPKRTLPTLRNSSLNLWAEQSAGVQVHSLNSSFFKKTVKIPSEFLSLHGIMHILILWKQRNLDIIRLQQSFSGSNLSSVHFFSYMWNFLLNYLIQKPLKWMGKTHADLNNSYTIRTYKKLYLYCFSLTSAATWLGALQPATHTTTLGQLLLAGIDKCESFSEIKHMENTMKLFKNLLKCVIESTKTISTHELRQRQCIHFLKLKIVKEMCWIVQEICWINISRI